MTAEGGRATLVEAFQRISLADAAAVAVHLPHDGGEVTWAEHAANVRRIASGLAALGVRHGDAVALLLADRPELQLVDTAALLLGAVPFSVPDGPTDSVMDVLQHARPRVVITDRAGLATVLSASASIRHVVCVDGARVGAIGLDDLEIMSDPLFDLEKAWRRVAPQDVCTLIYRRDDTGRLRQLGVTHSVAVARTAELARTVGIAFGDRMAATLPASTLGGRLAALYLPMMYGVVVTHASSDVPPTIRAASTTEWEQLASTIEAELVGSRSTVARALQRTALALGLRRSRLGGVGAQLDRLAEALWWVADKAVLGRIRSRHGLHELRWVVADGAPLSPYACELFLALGMHVTRIPSPARIQARRRSGLLTILDRKSSRSLTELHTIEISMPT